MYDVSGRYLWQALGAAAVLVLAGGIVFNLVLGIAGRAIFLAAIVYLLTGIGVAEALSAAVNRKRGPRLQVLAVAGTFLITQSAPLLALALSARLRLDLLGLLLTAVACAIAWGRLR